jgi:hypothetical protein
LGATLSITTGKEIGGEWEKKESGRGHTAVAVEYCRMEDCGNISKIPRTMIVAASLGLRRKVESV